jgi:hypothetical protein
MQKIKALALAGMTALALAACQARADGPPADKTDKPAAEKPAKVVPPLTDESVKEMLDNMGFDFKAEPVDKTVIYHLTFDQDGWNFHVDVALSSDKEQLWISSGVATLPDVEKVPAATLLRLLAENNNIGPSAIYYDKASKHISLAQALTNRGGLTPAVVRTHLNQFLGDVKDVMKLCDFPKADDKAEVKKGDDKGKEQK